MILLGAGPLFVSSGTTRVLYSLTYLPQLLRLSKRPPKRLTPLSRGVVPTAGRSRPAYSSCRVKRKTPHLLNTLPMPPVCTSSPKPAFKTNPPACLLSQVTSRIRYTTMGQEPSWLQGELIVPKLEGAFSAARTDV